MLDLFWPSEADKGGEQKGSWFQSLLLLAHDREETPAPVYVVSQAEKAENNLRKEMDDVGVWWQMFSTQHESAWERFVLCIDLLIAKLASVLLVTPDDMLPQRAAGRYQSAGSH